MPVEIGPEWDPAAHDYGNGNWLPATGPGREMALIMGLGALAAFATVGVLVAFGVTTVAAGIGGVTVTVAADGTILTTEGAILYVDGFGVGHTAAEAYTALDAAMAVGETIPEWVGPTLVEASKIAMVAGIAEGNAWDVAAILVLAEYEPPTQHQQTGFDIHIYLDALYNHLGDPYSGEPPEGGGAGGHAPGSGGLRAHGHWFCVETNDGVQYCTWEAN